MNLNYAATQRRLSQIRAALAKEPLAPKPLAAAIYLDKCHVYEYIHHLHDEGEIHVGAWIINRANHTPVYTLGPGPDAVRPPNRGRQRAAAPCNE